MEFLLKIKVFRIDFLQKLHDNLTSIVDGFIITTNLWIIKKNELYNNY